MNSLAVVVPSRGRPHHVARMHEAWKNTGAVDVADLVWALDADDPAFDGYAAQAYPFPAGRVVVHDEWQPMVLKLDTTAAALVVEGYTALAFMGDDHVPRSNLWAQRFIGELAELGTGIVYGNDLFQCHNLPTQWAMSADIVRALGRMVPAPVDHLFCDNSVLALGKALGRIRYLGDVVIEHMHPVAGKGDSDPQYERVNSDAQNRADRVAYSTWLGSEQGLAADVAAIRAECGLS